MNHGDRRPGLPEAGLKIAAAPDIGGEHQIRLQRGDLPRALGAQGFSKLGMV